MSNHPKKRSVIRLDFEFVCTDGILDYACDNRVLVC
jgi:hypothetical protein